MSRDLDDVHVLGLHSRTARRCDGRAFCIEHDFDDIEHDFNGIEHTDLDGIEHTDLDGIEHTDLNGIEHTDLNGIERSFESSLERTSLARCASPRPATLQGAARHVVDVVGPVQSDVWVGSQRSWSSADDPKLIVRLFTSAVASVHLPSEARMSEKLDYRQQAIFEAVCDMVPKSEQLSSDVLVSAYVNMGHAEKCTTATHQYIDGRRGTGKTHLLGYLAASVNAELKSKCQCAIYLDLRNLAIESGDPDGPKSRARELFRELILQVADGLRKIAAEHLWQNEVPTERTPWEKLVASKSHTAIDTLFTAAIVGVDRPTSLGRSTTIEKATDATAAEASIQASLGLPTGTSATAKGLFSWLRKREKTTENQAHAERRISYLEIKEAVEEFLDTNDLERLYLLLDEWSSIPASIQPQLAELLKRAFMPSAKITLKVATLPFQTIFSATEGRDTIGFERNGDIYQAIDLDGDLVYQRNPDRSSRVLGSALHRHLALALRKLVNDKVGLPQDAKTFMDELLTEGAHVRLLKFSHGNPRDYLTLFKKAYVDWRESDSPKMNVDNITRAARDFGSEKLDTIKENAAGYGLLQKVLKEILHEKHQGVFMVREQYSKSLPLQYLVHSRVLHVYDRSYSSPSYAGERFAVLAIDYCVIVDHLNAPNYRHILNAPELALEEANSAGRAPEQDIPEWVSKLLELQDPDRRKIRGAVLGDEHFETKGAVRCQSCNAEFDSGHRVFVKHGLCPTCGEPPAESPVAP